MLSLGEEVAVGIHTDGAGDQLVAFKDAPQTHDEGGADGEEGAESECEDETYDGNDDLQQTSAHIAEVEVVNAEHAEEEGHQRGGNTAAGLGVTHDEEGRAALGAFSCPGFGLSAAIGAVVDTKATLVVTLLAGIFLICQFSAAISAKHKIHTFLFV